MTGIYLHMGHQKVNKIMIHPINIFKTSTDYFETFSKYCFNKKKNYYENFLMILFLFDTLDGCHPLNSSFPTISRTVCKRLVSWLLFSNNIECRLVM